MNKEKPQTDLFRQFIAKTVREALKERAVPTPVVFNLNARDAETVKTELSDVAEVDIADGRRTLKLVTIKPKNE